ncbi:hypothetical protein MJL81_32785, partial [Salmonella enterica subsp. enterica serovar Anatum]|nr:hypothetical protein [Salmonella enterica subsp. enterica serovar Anatum]
MEGVPLPKGHAVTEGQLVSIRLSSSCHIEARNLPAHRRTRFLASRGLLAELMF